MPNSPPDILMTVPAESISIVCGKDLSLYLNIIEESFETEYTGNDT